MNEKKRRKKMYIIVMRNFHYLAVLEEGGREGVNSELSCWLSVLKEF